MRKSFAGPALAAMLALVAACDDDPPDRAPTCERPHAVAASGSSRMALGRLAERPACDRYRLGAAPEH